MTGIDGVTERGTVWLRVAAVAAVVLVVGVAAGAAMMGAQPTGDEVLDRAADRYDGATSYVGTAVLTGSFENETTREERSARARVQYRAPANYRVDVLAPAEYNGTVAATNGSVAWVARPTGQTVLRPLNESQQSWLERANVSATLDRLRENATLTNRGTTTVNGEESYVVAVEPTNDSHRVNATVYVDTEDYRVHRITTVARTDDATVRTTITYESVSFDVAIHESAFQPPADRSVIVASSERTTYDSIADARENVALPVPDPAVPDGLDRTGIVVSEYSGSTTVALTYGNDTDRLAVVVSERDPTAGIDADTESVQVGDHEASYLRRDDTGVVFWTADGTSYAVAGSLSKESLVAVASSVAG